MAYSAHCGRPIKQERTDRRWTYCEENSLVGVPVHCSRRRAIALGTGLGLSALVGGCDRWRDKPIAVAAHVWPGYEPIFLAQREGWLDHQQVQLLETRSATESLHALATGKAQGAALTLDEVLRARAGGMSLTVVLIFDISAGADMLLARHPIQRLADIKGRRVGFEPGAVGELMLAQALGAAGLERQDVALVPVSIDQQQGAWLRKELDAVITYEPVASRLLAQDAERLYDSRQIPNTIVDVLAVRSDALDREDRASAVRHLVAAHFRALDHFRRNPQDAAYRMTRHLNLPVAQVLPAFKGLVLPDALHNQRLLGGAEPELLASAHKLVQVMLRSQLLTQEDSLNSLVRADFLPAESLTD